MSSASQPTGARLPVVLITGASAGIGWSAALAFARAGYHVVGTARRAERLADLAHHIAELPAPHGEFLGVVGDVSQPEFMPHAVQQTLARFGKLDVLVANAGVGQRGTVADSDWQDIQTLLRTNIDGVLHSIRAAVPALRANGGGHILTVSSVVYNLVSPYTASYAASKAFVSSLANSLRLELAADQIRVTDFLVGRTATEFNEKRLGAGKRTSDNLPTMTPETVAQALVAAVGTRKQTVILRWFDRLIVLGNRLAPALMGELAKRQYK